MKAAKFLVGGRVQGVYYRVSAREKAQQLGLDGHAINLPDGRVEVLACGDADALEAFEQWLWQGPALARVDEVQRFDWIAPVASGFATG